MCLYAIQMDWIELLLKISLELFDKTFFEAETQLFIQNFLENGSLNWNWNIKYSINRNLNQMPLYDKLIAVWWWKTPYHVT